MGDHLKVLMLNGSPRPNGNIALAFREMEQVFAENGVEYENILLGRQPANIGTTFTVGSPVRETLMRRESR